MTYPSHAEWDALVESHRRLRLAAQGIVDACFECPKPENGSERRIYESQLVELRRELRHEPQPTNRLTWMSPT